MNIKEKKIEELLLLVDAMLHDHRDRNYGDRDVYIHKINNAWEDFIEEDENSDCPYLYKRKENME